MKLSDASLCASCCGPEHVLHVANARPLYASAHMAACSRSTAALHLQLNVIYTQPTSGPVDPDFSQKLLGGSSELAHHLDWNAGT